MANTLNALDRGKALVAERAARERAWHKDSQQIGHFVQWLIESDPMPGRTAEARQKAELGRLLELLDEPWGWNDEHDAMEAEEFAAMRSSPRLYPGMPWRSDEDPRDYLADDRDWRGGGR